MSVKVAEGAIALIQKTIIYLLLATSVSLLGCNRSEEMQKQIEMDNEQSTIPNDLNVSIGNLSPSEEEREELEHLLQKMKKKTDELEDLAENEANGKEAPNNLK